MPGGFGPRLVGFATYVFEHAHTITAFATEQLVDGKPDGLSKDVPKCNVDSAESGADDAPGEVRVSRDDLVVMLDQSRILPNEVGLEVLDGLSRRTMVHPEPSFTVAGDVAVGVDANEAVLVDEERFDVGDFHDGFVSEQ